MGKQKLLGTKFKESDFVTNKSHLKSVTEDGKLAGLNYQTLLEKYRADLFEDYLPYLIKHAVDSEYGGFMCNAQSDGTKVDTNKRSWYEGRGIWVFSTLYNKLGGDPVYYEIAKKTVEFVLKMKPEGDTFWPSLYTREGKAIEEGEIYGDLFVAMGFQEYSKIPGNEKYWDEAKEILLKCVRIYDSPTYPEQPFLENSPHVTAPRFLGHWMMISRIATEMLEVKNDSEVEAIAKRCVDAINKHYNPEFGLMNETLNHDLSRPNNMLANWSYVGHAIEVFWFQFMEAVRLKDVKLFNTVAERFMRHVEVAWDSVFGGVFRSIDDIRKNIFTLDVVLLFQVEALNGCILLAEHTGSMWASEWYEKFYDFIQNKYDLKGNGFSPWMSTGDRVETPDELSTPRIGNFHYPQSLIVNILSLERIIKRDGKVSASFI